MVELSPAGLAKLRALCEAATPGPWHLGGQWDGKTHAVNDGYDLGVADAYPSRVGNEPLVANARLIAAARTALPALLDALERERAENARLKEALRPFGEYLDTAAFDLNHKNEPLPDEQGMGWVYLTIGDFRLARAALSAPKEGT